MALLGGCRILTTWPHEPKPNSPWCSRSCILLWYFWPLMVIMPVSFIISWSRASISDCLELAEQLAGALLIPAMSRLRLILVGVPFGCRGTVKMQNKRKPVKFGCWLLVYLKYVQLSDSKIMEHKQSGLWLDIYSLGQDQQRSAVWNGFEAKISLRTVTVMLRSRDQN